MIRFIFIAAFFITSCNNGAQAPGEKADSPYNAITDTSKHTQDTLVVPDSTTPTVTH
jgi:hypothetical protein